MISQNRPSPESLTPAARIVVLPDNYESPKSEDHLFGCPAAFNGGGGGPRFPGDGPPGPSSDDDDPDFPDDDLFTPDPDSDEELPAEQIPADTLAQLASTINNLAHYSRRPSSNSTACTKVREPDQFDGTNPRKLQVFLVQCELNYQDRPKAFCTNHAKVTFAQSYLKGMALEWFEPDLLMEDPALRPLWMDNFREFVLELQTNFGPHDPVRDAEHQLDHLSMKDGQRITDRKSVV